METLRDGIREALRAGVHPREVRRQLQKSGVSWRYSGRHQGTREAARRLRQIASSLEKRRLCANGDGKPRAGQSDLCVDCLNDRWAPE